jgi:hypothetical protein
MNAAAIVRAVGTPVAIGNTAIGDTDTDTDQQCRFCEISGPDCRDGEPCPADAIEEANAVAEAIEETKRRNDVVTAFNAFAPFRKNHSYCGVARGRCEFSKECTPSKPCPFVAARGAAQDAWQRAAACFPNGRETLGASQGAAACIDGTIDAMRYSRHAKPAPAPLASELPITFARMQNVIDLLNGTIATAVNALTAGLSDLQRITEQGNQSPNNTGEAPCQ